MRGNLAQEAEGPRLVAAFPALAGEPHGAVGAGAGVLDLVREQVRLAELHDAERVEESDPRGFVGGQGLLQQEMPSSMRPDHAYTCPRDAIAIGVQIVMFHSRQRATARSSRRAAWLSSP